MFFWLNKGDFYDMYCLFKLYGWELFEFLFDMWEYFYGDFFFVFVLDWEVEIMKKIILYV